MLGIEPTQRIHQNTIPSNEDDNSIIYHKNFGQYLALAWAKHFSVFISPDISQFISLTDNDLIIAN